MKKPSEAFPLIACAGLIVLSVLLVVLGHKQGDAKAAVAAAATAAAPTQAPTSSVRLTVTPAAAAASGALAKPAAAD